MADKFGVEMEKLDDLTRSQMKEEFLNMMKEFKELNSSSYKSQVQVLEEERVQTKKLIEELKVKLHCSKNDLLNLRKKLDCKDEALFNVREQNKRLKACNVRLQSALDNLSPPGTLQHLREQCDQNLLDEIDADSNRSTENDQNEEFQKCTEERNSDYDGGRGDFLNEEGNNATLEDDVSVGSEGHCSQRRSDSQLNQGTLTPTSDVYPRSILKKDSDKTSSRSSSASEMSDTTSRLHVIYNKLKEQQSGSSIEVQKKKKFSWWKAQNIFGIFLVIFVICMTQSLIDYADK